MPSPLYSRFTEPFQFDDVAADFPDMNIVLAHSGQDHWPEALSVARSKPNVYLELSMWQPKWKYPDEFLFAINRMRDTIGIERILWGSDFPGLRSYMSLKEWTDLFKRLPSLGEEHGYRFDDGDVDALLGGNSARLLKMS
jgi:predicted TIM-barrel fold metal-dependent hydrolase